MRDKVRRREQLVKICRAQGTLGWMVWAFLKNSNHMIRKLMHTIFNTNLTYYILLYITYVERYIILNPDLCCGCPRGRSLHKALHFSKRYCDCSDHNPEEPKKKKICHHEKSIKIKNITARGTSSTLANVLGEHMSNHLPMHHYGQAPARPIKEPHRAP